jgi:hypothetical protein
MRRLRLYSHDDVDCARASLMRAMNAKRGIKAARDFYRLILLAHKNDNLPASAAVRAHPLWSKHCVRLAEMRRNGELDLIHRDRVYVTNFFREHELHKYEEWREEQRFILQAMGEPIPDCFACL